MALEVDVSHLEYAPVANNNNRSSVANPKKTNSLEPNYNTLSGERSNQEDDNSYGLNTRSEPPTTPPPPATTTQDTGYGTKIAVDKSKK